MRVGIASVRGAPGVSVVVAAMACAAHEALLVVEADTAGSAVTPRWGWEDSRDDLTRLAGEDGDVAASWDRARPWLGRSRVVVAGSSPVAMSDATTADWTVRMLNAATGPTLVDVGRLGPSRYELDVLAALDELWLVLDHDIEQLTSARSWMPPLDSLGVPCRVLLRDRVPWTDGEVASTLGVPVSGRVPTDPRCAAALSGRASLSDRLVRRSPLVRATVPWVRFMVRDLEPA